MPIIPVVMLTFFFSFVGGIFYRERIPKPKEPQKKEMLQTFGGDDAYQRTSK